MAWPEFLERPEIAVFLIPIVGIIVAGVVSIVTLLIRHRERMAMIEQGMDPDARREQTRARALDAWTRKTATPEHGSATATASSDPASVFYRPEHQTTR